MKILFQGGFKRNRGEMYQKKDFVAYLDEFAKQLVLSNHQVILTHDYQYDNPIASKVLDLLNGNLLEARKFVIYYLADRIKSIPKIGIVKKYHTPDYWINERTIQVQYFDCLLVIGGGKGTVDCMEKSF